VRTHHRPFWAASVIAGLALLNAPSIASVAKETAPATGRVHYRMSSPIMNGTSVVSWIDHGRKFRQDSKMTIGATASKSPMQTWSIGDGTNVYAYQPALGKQVLRMKIPKSAGGGGPMGGTPFVASGSGTVVGKATVLGRSCEIRALGPKSAGPNVKMWVWNGVPLRTEMILPQGGKMTTEATNIETAPKLSPALFKLPAGYTIKEMPMPAGALGAPPRPPR
jgi:outer membrane lipoprotein-sorting protein